jgi:hypothetical protein
MSVPRRWALVILVPLIVGACGCGGRDSSTAEQKAAAAPGGVPPLVVLTPDTTLLSAVYDTTVVRFSGGEVGRRLKDEPGSWAVDYTWFYLIPEATQLFTFDQMEELAAAGRITDTTEVGLAIYRVRIHGASTKEARADVDAKRPKEAPAQLYQALARPLEAAPSDTSLPR